MIYKSFYDFWYADNPDKQNHIKLHQEDADIGGGKISIDDIDRINEYDNMERVQISGLRQDTFEYFIEKYGNKIKYIYFFKNKMVEDFSILSTLTQIRGISFFHNQRATKLWDMSSNYELEALNFEDFTRLHSLEGIQTAPNLRYLTFGDAIWSTSKLFDLNPLIGTKLISFGFNGKSIENKDITVYTELPELKYLNFPTNFYTTEELAQIVALCPHLSGYALTPYVKFNRISHGEKDVVICGKRKPFLNSEKDAVKIEKYVKKFHALVEQYKREYQVLGGKLLN